MPTSGENTEAVLCENGHPLSDKKVEQQKIVFQFQPYLEPIVKRRLAQCIALKLENDSIERVEH